MIRIGAAVAAATLGIGLLTAPAHAAPQRTLEPDRLASAARPTVLHQVGRTIFDGNRRVPLTGLSPTLLGPAGDGYVVRVQRPAGPTGLQWVSHTGRGRWVPLPAKIQWRYDDDTQRLLTARPITAQRTVVEVRHRRTGAVTHRIRVPGPASVADSHGSSVFIATDGALVVWDLATGSRTRTAGLDATYVNAAADQVFTTSTARNCFGLELRRLSRPGTVLRRVCDRTLISSAPDGSFVTDEAISTSEWPGDPLRVIRVHGPHGRVIASLRARHWLSEDIRWVKHRGRHAVVLEVGGRRGRALVRCAGVVCTRVSPVRPPTERQWPLRDL